MPIFIVIMLSVLVLGQLFCCVMLIRNDRVHKFRTRVLDISVFDIETEKCYPYSLMPEYKKMVWQFWKPLEKYLDEAMIMQKVLGK